MTKPIIVMCPGQFRTGGPEALHQLVHQLNQLKDVKGYIYYYGEKIPQIIAEYQSFYQVHETPYLNIPGASIIFPEPLDPRLIPTLEGGDKWVWWLSAERYWPLRYYEGCGHLFQSHYAKTKLGLLGASGLMLTDYLRQTFHEKVKPNLAKKSMITFNAIKSSMAALQLAYGGANASVLPIIGMSTAQVQQALLECKVYMDFGWHPGRDRLPREAVLSGCLVVTGRDGAADNAVDIPIPETYKIELDDLASRAKWLVNLVNEYEQRQQDFAHYRELVLGQEQQFIGEVAEIAQTMTNAGGITDYLCTPTIDAALDDYLMMQERRARAWQITATQQALRSFQKAVG